mmetsp:Transcript_8358/g.21399  ORF Transcript_8358/g.21399 Transcript_8358/m.21399 type:complete len:265 (-) Transcript_8358:1436-2230(-)
MLLSYVSRNHLRHSIMDESLAYEGVWPIEPVRVVVVPKQIHEVGSAINLKTPDCNPSSTALPAVELVHLDIRIPPLPAETAGIRIHGDVKSMPSDGALHSKSKRRLGHHARHVYRDLKCTVPEPHIWDVASAHVRVLTQSSQRHCCGDWVVQSAPAQLKDLIPFIRPQEMIYLTIHTLLGSSSAPCPWVDAKLVGLLLHFLHRNGRFPCVLVAAGHLVPGPRRRISRDSSALAGSSACSMEPRNDGGGFCHESLYNSTARWGLL